MTQFRACALIPSYNNPITIREVVERVRRHLSTVIVVDDGSDAPARRELDALHKEGVITLCRREHNGGKGAAMKSGLAKVSQMGFTHALQVDADLQHNLDDIPTFLEAAREQPGALVLGYPEFDDTRPVGRNFGHALTAFWTRLEVGSAAIKDPQCGFRVYPIEAATSVHVRSDRMAYDVEVCVRMVWHGCAVVNLSTPVRYLTPEVGGVSHFHMFYDNVRISWMHTRLVTLAIWRRLTRVFRAPAKR